MIDLYKGDCLEVMDELIAKGVVVDAIITDPPYQTTACDWDILIPFNNHIMQQKSKRSKKLQPIYRDEYILQELKNGREYQEICEYFDKNSKDGMWQKLNKLIKPNGAIVLFGSEPFSSALRMSNIKNYKYDWKWDKKQGGNPLNAKKQPLRTYEDIIVFNKHNYYPIKKTRGKPRKKGGINKQPEHTGKVDINYSTVNNEYYPKAIIEFSNAVKRGKVHPTQKPVALMEYLVKTYTNKNEVILDFTMGSGTTGVACKNLGRKFIGIELDENYFNIAKERIEKTQKT